LTTQQTQQPGVKVPSQALPSDGMSRFVRRGAWAAMVGGVAVVVSVPVTMFLDPTAGTFQESIEPALWGFAAYGFTPL
jgi:hypothetical protein